MKQFSRREAVARVTKLRTLIDDYRYHYHVLDESIMSEAAADSLKHKLSELETRYPELLTADSPTQRVAGQALPGFTQVRHQVRMVSLQDVFSREEVTSWIERTHKFIPQTAPEYFVDLKLDGLACSLVYQDGVFVQAVTRGDGLVGEDVTTNVRTIESVPFNLRNTSQYSQFMRGRTEIRGEIVIYKKDFAVLNEERLTAGQPAFANPRNLAAGSIRQLDPKLAAARPLRFQAWDILRDNPTDIPTFAFAYNAIRALGVVAGRYVQVLTDINELTHFADEWENKRYELPYNTDGLVIKLNDRQLYNNLGIVGKTPRGAVAYKYAAEEATTIIRDIVLSIGRTGAATPVAVFDPVVVAGTTVQHASLHNADEIARKDIRVGDTVVIFKAGEIIPQVSRVLIELRLDTANAFDMEAELRRQYPELDFIRPEGEAIYRVKGATAKILLKQALEHFASKAALDIDGMGEKNVAVLVDTGLVQDLADIYTLTKGQVILLDRFAELSTSNLITAIAASKSPELPRFIYGLGIRHVGAQTAIDLAEQFGSLKALQEASLDALLNVNGVGEVVAESVVAWFAEPDNQTLLAKFGIVGVTPHYVSRVTGPLYGKTFVVTGTLHNMSRDAVAERVRALGGTFQSSVGKDTMYLVVGDNVGASKLVKAEKLGIQRLSEADLLHLLSGA
jgi:DNA ligase (NAD+)